MTGDAMYEDLTYLTVKTWVEVNALKYGYDLSLKSEGIINGLVMNQIRWGNLYCPCQVKSDDTICPCKNFMINGECICGLFEERY